jgi:hypothetical protein
MCITDGILRAQLDGELTEAESGAVRDHLATCQDCGRRAEALAARSEHASALFSTLANSTQESAVTDPQFALARFKTRHARAVLKNRSLFSRFFAGRLQPAWGALAVLMLVVIIGVSPSRVWAEKLLELFRVKQITVVSLDTNLLRFGDVKFEKRISQLLSRDIVVTKEPGAPQMARNADEASALSGFKVRLPSERTDAPQLKVEGEYAFHLTVDRSRLQTIFDEAGRSDLQLPAALDGATIGVDIPKATIAVYGDWPKAGPAMTRNVPVDWSKCLALAQVPSPAVTTPPDLNISQIAEMGLQLAGMSPEQAHNFSQTVDWTSTLVIPIPQDAASFQTVEVDGVKGTLISQHPMEDTPVGSTPAGFTLLWVKNGIIYSMTGFGDSSRAVPLAESLR